MNKIEILFKKNKFIIFKNLFYHDIKNIFNKKFKL